MSTQETANRLVELCRQGENEQAYRELFTDDAIAVEPEGSTMGPQITEGLPGLLQKNRQFGETIEEMHSMSISDPLVTDNFFTCTMEMDVTMKGFGRSKSSEVVVYETNDEGKIVKEQFFYTPSMDAASAN